MSAKKGIVVPEQLVAKLLKKHGFVLRSMEPYDGGYCNPIWFLTTAEKVPLVLKVTNPTWEVRKTVNEATVTKFIGSNTSIPVPELITYSASKDELGYEYILMKRAPGRPLVAFFHSLPDDEQKEYLRQLAGFVSQLLELRFPMIGAFNEDMEVSCDIDGNGPFNSVVEYLMSNMTTYLTALKKSGSYREYTNRLEKFKERILAKYEGSCNIVLTHNDLMLKNMMGHDGRITAILDWELAMAAPSDIYFDTFSELTDEGRKYIYDILESKGIRKPKAAEERQHLYDAEHLSMCLAYYPSWFDGRPDEERDYVSSLTTKIERLLSTHGV